ncbi:MAG: hypothetical protein HY783_00670 [Chloroflexi bacterium]|nr:hypothetical protein [Chloroflexota bacterium]
METVILVVFPGGEGVGVSAGDGEALATAVAVGSNALVGCGVEVIAGRVVGGAVGVVGPVGLTQAAGEGATRVWVLGMHPLATKTSIAAVASLRATDTLVPPRPIFSPANPTHPER